MNGLITWFAKNHVAANLLMLSIVVAGAFSLFGMRREMFPEASLDQVVVTVAYPGATPAEVEEGVVVRIEEAIADLVGIDTMTSIANEGFGTVSVEVEDGFNVRELLDDVKTRVDAISSLPENAERPTVEAPVLRREVLNLNIYGAVSEHELRQLAERVRDDLLEARRAPQGVFQRVLAMCGLFNDGDMTQVELAGERDYEIGIELREADLRRFGLTFDEVATAVRRSSLDLPAGSIKRQAGEILLRTKGQAYSGEEFARLVLRSGSEGERVLLGDVAEVRDGFADQDVRGSFDGAPSLAINVFRVGEQDVVAIADVVHHYVEAIAPTRLPGQVQLVITNDASKHFRERMDTLTSNAISGLILVFISLGLFLRLRLAFWVSMGIPMAFLGAFWLMPYADGSLNMISLFAFILVLGIVVDDAIVVGEAVYAHQERGELAGRGAVAGTISVATPVIFAVLTTIITFAPLLFLSGVHGKFWRVIPIVVIACLSFSLIESLLVLPAHLSRKQDSDPARAGYYGRLILRLQDGVTVGLHRSIRGIYEPLLRFALSWRYLTLCAFLAAVVVSGGLVAGGFVRFVGFPTIAADFVRVSVEMPNGTHRDQTWAVLDRLGEGIERLREEYDGQHPEQPPLFGHLGASLTSANKGLMVIELIGSAARKVDAEEIQRRWRQEVGEIPGVRNLEFAYQFGPGGGDLTIELASDDLAQLEDAAVWLKERLGRFKGVFNLSDSFSDGKDELVLRIKPEAEALGLRLDDLARQMRGAFYGVEAQRIQRGRDEVKVMVRYPEGDRRSLAIFDDMRIRGADGREVPFAAVASVQAGVGYPAIRRVDRQRVVMVSCEVDSHQGDSGSITSEIGSSVFAEVHERFPSVKATFEGSTRHLAEMLGELKIGFILALLAMWGLMAVGFRHYLQPILVLSAIPFGIIGAIAGHFLLGYDLNMLSMMGIVALSGVVVNDSLVLIDAINGMRAGGMPLREAIVQGGRLRFRAILLTTLTTFLGLMPLMLETSLQARFLIPMAISLAFGVAFATVITLLLVPALYLMLDDLGRLFGSRVAEDVGQKGED